MIEFSLIKISYKSFSVYYATYAITNMILKIGLKQILRILL